jgi:uncharacterized protein (TIGR03435 family)
MKPTIVGSSLIVFLASSAAFAQTAPAALSFEAASLKLTASPGTQEKMFRSMVGGPGSSDPGRFTYTNVTLKVLVQMAYNLKEFQVEGPDWIDGAGYDLIATMPKGTTKEQAEQMMQTLLADRFKLQFHRETKQMSVFALVVGKGGPKMKEADPEAAMPEAPPPGVGRGPQGQGRGTRMMMSPSGIHLWGQITMAGLAATLARPLAHPVLDETELPKTYDVDITWMPDNFLLPGGGPGGPDGPGREGGRNSASEPTMTLTQALQEKLGLKLETRKSPAEVLIVDHAEKAPVEN